VSDKVKMGAAPWIGVHSTAVTLLHTRVQGRRLVKSAQKR
jgi:hypothetical protein